MCCLDGSCNFVYLAQHSPYLNLDASSKTPKDSISEESYLVHLISQVSSIPLNR